MNISGSSLGGAAWGRSAPSGSAPWVPTGYQQRAVPDRREHGYGARRPELSREAWVALAASARYRPGNLAALRQESVRQLWREIHRAFGCSGQDFLHQVRLRAAVQLLRARKSCKTVEIELHFTDGPAFCRWFQKHMGINPSQFAKRPFSPQQPT